jgi:hypothetical protein
MRTLKATANIEPKPDFNFWPNLNLDSDMKQIRVHDSTLFNWQRSFLLVKWLHRLTLFSGIMLAVFYPHEMQWLHRRDSSRVNPVLVVTVYASCPKSR